MASYPVLEGQGGASNSNQSFTYDKHGDGYEKYHGYSGHRGDKYNNDESHHRHHGNGHHGHGNYDHHGKHHQHHYQPNDYGQQLNDNRMSSERRSDVILGAL